MALSEGMLLLLRRLAMLAVIESFGFENGISKGGDQSILEKYLQAEIHSSRYI